MELVLKRSEDRSRKTEERANLRLGSINGKYLNKENWQSMPYFH